MADSKGGVVNMNALYRAGVASKSQGRNMAAEQHNAFLSSVIDFGTEIVKDQVTQGLKNRAELKKERRNQVNEQLQTFGDIGRNQSITDEIYSLKNEYTKLKRKRKDKEALAVLNHLHNINAGIGDVRAGHQTAKVQTSIQNGTNNPNDENVPTESPNPANYIIENTNRTTQARNQFDKQVRYDRTANDGQGGFFVVTGGEWLEDENGNEYYGRNYNQTPSHVESFGKKVFDMEDKNNWVRFKDFHIGMKDNPFLSDQLFDQKQLNITNATNDNYHMFWESKHKPAAKQRIFNAINSSDVNEEMYLSWFFGGSNDGYSDTKIATSSPAYKYLLADDIKNGRAILSGVTKEDLAEMTLQEISALVDSSEEQNLSWEEGFGPDTESWVLNKEALKGAVRNGQKHDEYHTWAAQVWYDDYVKDYENTRRTYDTYTANTTATSETTKKNSTLDKLSSIN